MARYEYFCPACKRGFEVEKAMGQSARAEICPHCSTRGERIFTAPGIAIKGAPIKFKAGEQIAESGACHGCCNDACNR